jgi:hypothetical protein
MIFKLEYLTDFLGASEPIRNETGGLLSNFCSGWGEEGNFRSSPKETLTGVWAGGVQVSLIFAIIISVMLFLLLG